MKNKILTFSEIQKFKAYLSSGEKSAATTEKYLRDVKAFACFAGGAGLTKETVIAYKKHLQENYAVRCVNSALASLNSFFGFLGWGQNSALRGSLDPINRNIPAEQGFPAGTTRK